MPLWEKLSHVVDRAAAVPHPRAARGLRADEPAPACLLLLLVSAMELASSMVSLAGAVDARRDADSEVDPIGDVDMWVA